MKAEHWMTVLGVAAVLCMALAGRLGVRDATMADMQRALDEAAGANEQCHHNLAEARAQLRHLTDMQREHDAEAALPGSRAYVPR